MRTIDSSSVRTARLQNRVGADGTPVVDPCLPVAFPTHLRLNCGSETFQVGGSAYIAGPSLQGWMQKALCLPQYQPTLQHSNILQDILRNLGCDLIHPW